VRKSSNLDIKEALSKAKTIAVVGLSKTDDRVSNRIGRYLMNEGKYRIIPVNPSEEEILGEKCYPSLSAIPADIKIDVVNVFRRAEFLPEIAQEAIERGVDLFWAQLGLYNDKAEAMLKKAMIPYVMDACIFVEHRACFF